MSSVHLSPKISNEEDIGQHERKLFIEQQPIQLTIKVSIWVDAFKKQVPTYHQQILISTCTLNFYHKKKLA